MATLEFFGNLLELLRDDPRAPRIINLKDHPQLKDAIESCGVPHCEVGDVTINDVKVPLDKKLKADDIVRVFPIKNPLVPNLKFAVDCNLGKLNSLLRSLGFDCFYENDVADLKILKVAVDENRMLLTKDRRLLMRKELRHGYFVRSIMPVDQLKEVLERFSLQSEIKLLTRCIDCNVPTQRISKEEVLDRLQPLTKQFYNEFNICPKCLKIFWRGTHYERINHWARTL
jgi:uncharacterized protein